MYNIYYIKLCSPATAEFIVGFPPFFCRIITFISCSSFEFVGQKKNYFAPVGGKTQKENVLLSLVWDPWLQMSLVWNKHDFHFSQSYITC